MVVSGLIVGSSMAIGASIVMMAVVLPAFLVTTKEVTVRVFEVDLKDSIMVVLEVVTVEVDPMATTSAAGHNH